MTAPSRRPWSLWDGPKCLHTGSVVADSDADGLRAVLLGAEATGRVPLDPRRHYRVRCGSAVASAAGDEFVRTSESSSMPDDAPAHEAKAERERVEAEAKRALERELAERLLEAGRVLNTGRAEAEEGLESLADWATPRADGKGKARVRCPATPDGVHEYDPVRGVDWDSSYDSHVEMIVVVGSKRCRLCHDRIEAAVYADPRPYSAHDEAERAMMDVVGALSRAGRGVHYDYGWSRRLAGLLGQYAAGRRGQYAQAQPGVYTVYVPVGGGGSGGAPGGSGNASASSSTHPGSGNGNAGGGGVHPWAGPGGAGWSVGGAAGGP